MEDMRLKQVTEELQELQYCKHERTRLSAQDARVLVQSVHMLDMFLGLALSSSRSLRIRRATRAGKAYTSGKYRGPCTQFELRNDEVNVRRLEKDQSGGYRFRSGLTFEIEVDSRLIGNGVADGAYRMQLVCAESGQAVPWKELEFWIAWKGI